MPPVEHVDLAQLADHHVVGLEVAVHHAAPVRELERVADLREDLEVAPEGVLRVARPGRVLRVVDQRREGHPLDPLHHEDRVVVVGPGEEVRGDDVRVIEPARDRGLAEERVERGGAAAVRAHALDRDLAREGPLHRRLDAAHPALRDRAEELEVGVLARARSDADARQIPRRRQRDRLVVAPLDERALGGQLVGRDRRARVARERRHERQGLVEVPARLVRSHARAL